VHKRVLRVKRSDFERCSKWTVKFYSKPPAYKELIGPRTEEGMRVIISARN
jgi:hypothetical protein